MSPEDALKVKILARAWGVSQEEVKARGVRLLYDMLMRGDFQEPIRVPIRVGNKVKQVPLDGGMEVE